MPRKLSPRAFAWRLKLPCVSAHRRDLSAYLDGELEPGPRAGMERHLAVCARCRATYAELRFASRALTHFVVPEAPPPAWRAVAPPPSRVARPTFSGAWQRFCVLQLHIPAPAALAAVLAIIAFIVAMPRVRPASPLAAPTSTGVPVTQVKYVEVPFEREVVREHVVTRVVYLRSPRPARPAVLTGKQMVPAWLARRDGTNAPPVPSPEQTPGVLTSLAGFRPASDANLRVVKEQER